MTVLEPVIRYLIDCPAQAVSLHEVMTGAERPRKPVMRVMDRLVREGHLEEIADSKTHLAYGEYGPRRRNPIWRILSKPVLTNPKAPKRRTVRDKMWQIVRARRRFTRRELRRLSGAGVTSAEKFTSMLLENGYLRIIGKDRQAHVYMLIKDPGPQRPILEDKRR